MARSTFFINHGHRVIAAVLTHRLAPGAEFPFTVTVDEIEYEVLITRGKGLTIRRTTETRWWVSLEVLVYVFVTLVIATLVVYIPFFWLR